MESWERTWVRAGEHRCGICRRRLPYTCVWVNYDTGEHRHLGCFTPADFVPDACTEEENEHAARIEARQCKRGYGPWLFRRR